LIVPTQPKKNVFTIPNPMNKPYITTISFQSMKLPDEFFQKKLNQLHDFLQKEELDAILLFGPANIAYVTGFFHLQTERPLAAIIPKEGIPLLLIPLLEVDHVVPDVEVETYFDYPGHIDPIIWMRSHLKSRSLTRIALETSIGVVPFNKFSELDVTLTDIVSTMREIKEPEEITLISKAAEYADYAVERAAHHTTPGITEFEINEKTRVDVSERMLDELEEIVPVQGGLCGGLVCSGVHGAFPHGMPSSKKVHNGESIILSFGATVGGYHAESERTAFVGSPSDKQREAFNVMAEAQKTGGEAVAAGKKCSEVNNVCLNVIREHGYQKYLRHRMGHGIGLQGHEPPWVEEGDDTVLKKGMTISNEPGIYMPEFGGFRHSDTLLVTDKGSTSLTLYPKDIDSLII
jgi:Xaa-Pro dipeptidase